MHATKEVQKSIPLGRILIRNRGVFLTFALFLVVDPHAGDLLIAVTMTIATDGKLVGEEITI